MNAPSPIARAVLDIALLNPQGESVLHIGRGAQSLSLELANLTEQDLVLAKGSELRITFRPGTLANPDSVTVMGEGWSAKMHAKRTFFQTLVLTRASDHPLKPGTLHRIDLGNLVPSGSGGSRATRVEIEYRDITLPGEGPVSGRRTVHLSVLHPEIKDSSAAGNTASAGGITAQLLSSDEVVSGQGTATLEIALSADRALIIEKPPGEADDDLPQIHVGFPDQGTSLFFTGSIRGWNPGGRRLTYAGAAKKTLSGRFVGFKMTLSTMLKPGLYPLTLTLKNFDSTDRILPLLIRVTSVGRPEGSSVIQTAGALNVNGRLDVDATLSAETVHSRSGNLTLSNHWYSTATAEYLQWVAGRTGDWYRFSPKNSEIEMMLGGNKHLTLQPPVLNLGNDIRIDGFRKTFSIVARHDANRSLAIKSSSSAVTVTPSNRRKMVFGSPADINGKLTVTRGGANISGTVVASSLHLDLDAPNGRLGVFKLPGKWEIAVTKGPGEQLQLKRDGKTIMILDENGWINLYKRGKFSKRLN